MDETKTCTKCGETKSLTAFSKDRRRRDGKNPWCKRCMSETLAQWRVANPDYGKRRYAKNTEREKAHSKKWREANPEKERLVKQKSRARHPETGRARRQRYKERNPEKHKAHTAVNNAVYRGLLVKPDACERCEKPTESRRLHAHHRDYDKPLEVEWLCLPCHRALHEAAT